MTTNNRNNQEELSLDSLGIIYGPLKPGEYDVELTRMSLMKGVDGAAPYLKVECTLIENGRKLQQQFFNSFVKSIPAQLGQQLGEEFLDKLPSEIKNEAMSRDSIKLYLVENFSDGRRYLNWRFTPSYTVSSGTKSSELPEDDSDLFE